MQKQLYENQSNQYKPIFPIVRLEDIIDTITDKSLQWIFNNYNHIYVEWNKTKAGTRNEVPAILRRSGLWISYNNGKEFITEYFIGNNNQLNSSDWGNDSNWKNYTNTISDGSIEYQHLSDALKQLFVGGSSITNFPDEEDITVKGSVLKFKDKNYEPDNFSGLGRIILRKNIKRIDSEFKNVLTQEMINKENTIYEIKYDFDLNGEEITVPEGCVLDFQGGSLNNGTLELNNTIIEGQAKFDVGFLGKIGNSFFNVLWIIDEDFGKKVNRAQEAFANIFCPVCDIEFSTPIVIQNANGNIHFDCNLTYIGEASNNNAAITISHSLGINAYIRSLTCSTSLDYTSERTIEFIGIKISNSPQSYFNFHSIYGFNEGVRLSGDNGYGCSNIRLDCIRIIKFNYAVRIYQDGGGWCTSNKINLTYAGSFTSDLEILNPVALFVAGPKGDGNWRDLSISDNYDLSSDISFDGCNFEHCAFPILLRNITGLSVSRCREEDVKGLINVMPGCSVRKLHYIPSYKDVLGTSNIYEAKEVNLVEHRVMQYNIPISVPKLYNGGAFDQVINDNVILCSLRSGNIIEMSQSDSDCIIGALFELKGWDMLFHKTGYNHITFLAFFDSNMNNITKDIQDVSNEELWAFYRRNDFWYNGNKDDIIVTPLYRAKKVPNAKYVFIGGQSARFEENAELIINYNSAPILNQLPQRGDSESRPIYGLSNGKSYFDTTLNKPIWWTGTKWVDATGQEV